MRGGDRTFQNINIQGGLEIFEKARGWLSWDEDEK